MASCTWDPKDHGCPRCEVQPDHTSNLCGAQVNKIGKQTLELWGINGSVNMRIEYDDVAHDVALTHHCYLPTDHDHAPTSTQIQTGLAFIRQMVTTGNKVYIHCRSGTGRAPTMAAAYFVSQGYTLSKAMNLIQESRPFIQLSSRQMDQLKQFAEGQKKA